MAKGVGGCWGERQSGAKAGRKEGKSQRGSSTCCLGSRQFATFCLVSSFDGTLRLHKLFNSCLLVPHVVASTLYATTTLHFRLAFHLCLQCVAGYSALLWPSWQDRQGRQGRQGRQTRTVRGDAVARPVRVDDGGVGHDVSGAHTDLDKARHESLQARRHAPHLALRLDAVALTVALAVLVRATASRRGASAGKESGRASGRRRSRRREERRGQGQ